MRCITLALGCSALFQLLHPALHYSWPHVGIGLISQAERVSLTCRGLGPGESNRIQVWHSVIDPLPFLPCPSRSGGAPGRAAQKRTAVRASFADRQQQRLYSEKVPADPLEPFGFSFNQICALLLAMTRMITRSLSRSLQRPLPANECREGQYEEESFAPTVDNLLTGVTFWLVAALWFVLALDVSAWHASLLASVVQSTWLASYQLCNDSGFLLKITRAIPDRKLLFNFVAILYIVIVPSCVLGCAFTKALSTRYLCLAVWTFCLGTLFNLVRLGKFVEFPSRSPVGSSQDQSSPLKRFVVTTYSGHQVSSKRNSLTEAPLTVANVSIFLLTHHLGIFTCFHFGFQLGLPVLTTLILPMFGAASWLLTQDNSPRTFK